jgi:hypothetical protein
MSIELVLANLQKIYQTQVQTPSFSGSVQLTEDDVRRWSASIGTSRSALYDGIAVRLARGFKNSELSFEFCDAIVNGLYGIITSADEERPQLFWRVYLAFDEGEYYHGNDRREDPVEAYTRPMVAQILADVSSC